jgi:hypothetical protein
MVKHGAISRSHVYRMLRSGDAQVRRAAFTLLEGSNPRLRRDGELFMEIVRFIWDANPSYDVYREFSKRHLFLRYKVHELISARLRMEKQEQRRVTLDQRPEDERSGGFFFRLGYHLAAWLPLLSRGAGRRAAWPCRPTDREERA